MKKLTRGQMQALLDLALEQPREERDSPLMGAIEKLKENIKAYDASPRRPIDKLARERRISRSAARKILSVDQARKVLAGEEV